MSPPKSKSPSAVRSPISPRPNGMLAPIPRGCRQGRPLRRTRSVRASATTLFCRTAFCMRWKHRVRRPARRLGAFHLAIEDERERIAAVAPCYLKSHSQGEYVFDHGWADAYERAGGELLSEAAGLRAVHASDGPPAARRPGEPMRRGAQALIAGLRRAARADGRVLGARHIPDRGRNGARLAKQASCSAPTSSFTSSMPATRISTNFSPRSPRASARRSARSARGAARRHHHRMAHRARH